MNLRPLKQCKEIGCTELTRNKLSYCEDHIHAVEEKKAARNKNYDKNIRNKKHTNFYKSRDWISIRNYILTIYNGIDVYAYYVDDVVELANTVHHIVEIREDWEKRLNTNNLFPTAEANHNKIHSLYEKDKEGTQQMLTRLLDRYRGEFGIPPSF